MKFVLDALAASAFGIEHNLSEVRHAEAPRKAELYFGPSRGVTGHIDVTDGQTQFTLKTDGPLQIDRMAWPMGSSQGQVLSDLQFQAVDVDLTMHGATANGHTSFDSASADVLRVSLPALDEFAASDLRLKRFDLQADAGQLQVRIASIGFALLPIIIPAGSVRFERVLCEDLTFTFNPRGSWEARIGSLRAGRVAYNLAGVEGSLEDIRVSALSVLSAGDSPTFRVESITVASAHARSKDLRALLASKKPADKALPRSAPSPELLALLDLLSGTFNVDIITEIDLPILPAWRAKHPVRIIIEEGTVNYKELENNIGDLADAVLDFHVDDHTLKLDKDIPLIPFDRQTLVQWPLPERERPLADRGRVRLARLAQPLVKVEKNPKGKDKGVRFLEEIAATHIDVSLRVAEQASVKLPAGATLRLGDPDTPGIESLVAKGNIVYRTDDTEEEGKVQLGLRRTNFALGRLYVAGQRLSAAVQIETSALNADFLGTKPTAFELSLERASATSLVLTPSFRKDILDESPPDASEDSH